MLCMFMFQLMREFQRYKSLIKRPGISQEMVAERETLLGQLTVSQKDIQQQFTDAGNGKIPKGKNIPEFVNQIVFVRQLEAKVGVDIS